MAGCAAASRGPASALAGRRCSFRMVSWRLVTQTLAQQRYWRDAADILALKQELETPPSLECRVTADCARCGTRHGSSLRQKWPVT